MKLNEQWNSKPYYFIHIFNKKFDIYTGYSGFQLGEFITQRGGQILFYIIKLKGPYMRYMVMRKELLITVETIKDLCTILLVQKLNIYIDHKNHTCKYLILLDYLDG